MDLKLFLDQINYEVISEDLPPSSFQRSIFINKNISYELEGIDIVLLGVTDMRGAGDYKGGQAPDLVRQKLYKMSKNSGKNRILDLGNLRNGPSAEETMLRLKEVVSFFLSKGKLPVIFGGSQDLDFGQYQAYESMDKLITWLNIDARFDLDEKTTADRSHLAKILRYDPNYLFNYIHLGYQSYYVFPEEIRLMERLYFEAYRVGEIKERLSEMEPVIRDADAISFDISAIQSLYAPGTHQPNVFGLTGEEACQLCWYGGLNDKLSSIGLYNYLPEFDSKDHQTASVIATMIWYFIEGFYHRKGDVNFLTNDYLVYEVSLDENPESIRFFKSKLSEKWWMEIPDEEGHKSIFLRNKMVPCSYSDYEIASRGEVPERWLNAFTKINS